MTLPLLLGAVLASGFALKDGDRVVMYGDSITEAGHYANYLEAAVATRYPQLRVEFFNAGWAGDTSWGQYGWDGAGGSPEERIRRDVVPHKPSIVTVMLGMNDAGYVPVDAKIADTFEKCYRDLVRSIKKEAPSARLTLIRTSPWDDFTRPPGFIEGITGEGGYNAVLAKYGERVREVANEMNAEFVDFNAPVAGALTRAAKIDVKLAQQIIPDRIHPGAAGGLLMASELLKAWGMGSTVSEVHIDVVKKLVLKQEGALVTALDGLKWDQLDASLPLPIDPAEKVLQLAVRSSDVVEKLDRQIVRVVGLPEGMYKVKIDGDVVRTASDHDLMTGINLATVATPMLAQSLTVLRLTEKSNRAYHLLWRDVGFRLGKYRATSDAVRSLESLRKEILEERHIAAQPKKRHFELIPIGE